MKKTIMLLAGVSLAGLVMAQPDARLTAGQQKAAAGDVAGALQEYVALTLAQPDSYEAHARLGGMQLLDQRYAEAVRSFQQAISLGDPGIRSFVGMGMAYLHMGQPGAARAALEEARRRDDGSRKGADIADIIAWIDARDTDSNRSHR